MIALLCNHQNPIGKFLIFLIVASMTVKSYSIGAAKISLTHEIISAIAINGFNVIGTLIAAIAKCNHVK